MHQINLFNTTINLRSEHCTLNNCTTPCTIDKPYVNMYVQMTKECNASCKFCEFRGEKESFNHYKFKEVLKEIRSNVLINKVSFTGGEPTLRICNLLASLVFVKEVDDKIFTVVNTNGIKLNSLDFSYIDSIALSRHHYDDNINNQILGFKAPSYLDITNFKNKQKLHLSCNLIKGYIDNEEEVLKYLECASIMGVTDVGFVSLMKINDYCNEHHIDFGSLNFENEKNIFINREWNRGDTCRCRNYLYASNSNDSIVKAYSRYYLKRDNVESQLVYDGQYLRDGFNGKIII